MAESSHQQQRVAVGEVVEVQGGHIVRATGRKDRHSKVCTAKGPRDRRVRLAAHTAIQFYDVQDRLGYDRPSKAVDWLIKKAKSSIDELAQLPAWHPTATTAAAEELEQKQNAPVVSNITGSPSNRAATMVGGEDDRRRNISSHNPNTQISSFLPPSMDSDAIADTIKSFFPVGASGEATSSAMQFHSFNSSDLISRSGGHSQDLRLSLHSLQDPILLQHQSPTATHHHSQPPRLHGQVLLSGTPLGFDGGWADNNHQQSSELSRLQRFADAAPAAYFFNPPPAQPVAPPPPLLQQLLGHNQFISQRGPLQSSNPPSVRAWFDPPAAAASSGGFDHSHHHQQQGSAPFYPSSGFASGYGGFPGFHIPARIQGDEEEHDGYSDKPSSASSDSRH